MLLFRCWNVSNADQRWESAVSPWGTLHELNKIKINTYQRWFGEPDSSYTGWSMCTLHPQFYYIYYWMNAENIRIENNKHSHDTRHNVSCVLKHLWRVDVMFKTLPTWVSCSQRINILLYNTFIIFISLLVTIINKNTVIRKCYFFKHANESCTNLGLTLFSK